MEIELDQGEGIYQIKSYRNGSIVVNNQTYNCPIFIMPDLLLAPWGPTSFEDLTAEHFDLMLVHKPQVVLLGTGPKLRFPDPKLYAAITEQQIGVEVMDTGAACRTYTVLMAEGRRVAAGLF